MTDSHIPSLPSGNAAPRRRGARKRVGAQLDIALEAMVFEGLPRDAAATKAGMLDKSLYNALRKPHVRGEYLARLEVLRTSERARNIHAAVAVRDNETGNQMARIAACKFLDGEPASVNTNVILNGGHAGFVIDLSDGPGCVVVVSPENHERTRPAIDDKIIEIDQDE